MPRIIALCGIKRSGKDTAAEYIASKYGYKHVKFASPLKEACRLLFGLNNEQVEGDLKEVEDARWGVSPRKIMQFFGTELMQYELQRLIPHMDRRFWARSLLEQHGSERIVISDMRFVHEALEVLEHDRRAVIVRIERIAAPNDDAHASETEVKEIKCNAVAKNDSTQQDLFDSIDAILQLAATQATCVYK